MNLQNVGYLCIAGNEKVSFECLFSNKHSSDFPGVVPSQLVKIILKDKLPFYVFNVHL